MKSANPLRILAVCQNYWPEPFNVHEMCEGLAAAGHSVTVLTGLPNYPDGVIPADYRHGKNRRQRKNGVDIIRTLTIPRGENLKGVNLVKRVLNYASFSVSGRLQSRTLRGYDVVLAFGFSPMFMVEPAIEVAKRDGVPIVMYAIDLWPEDLLTGGVSKASALFGAMKKYSTKTYAKADVIAVTSPDFEGYITDYLGVTGARFRFLPQYAEDMFESLIGDNTQNDNESFDLVFAGNVGGNQALESAIDAIAMLPADSETRLHVYGSGSRLASCEERAAMTGAQNRIIFHGRKPLEEMPDVYSSADAMLLTLANPENGSLVPIYTIPRKLQSYMAAGKPIIASANGVAARIVNEAQCGRSCRGESPKELALAILEMESMTKSELKVLGDNARSFYKSNYARELFFERLESVIQGALG